MFTHLSATLDGLSTIRSFNLCEKLIQEFHECIDYQVEAYVMYLDSVRWFGQRTEILTFVFNCLAVFAPVIAARYSGRFTRPL